VNKKESNVTRMIKQTLSRILNS